ncbi:hypothetical protein HKX48_007318 [Thoreauomyces humboldtii]|nr:hypothetical protein HKX48_007318 [Thoreauomyces humboldtii]
MTFFRLNDQKALAWLKLKCEVILAKFESYTLLESVRNGEKHLEANKVADGRKHVAIRLLGDYLAPAWVDMLKKSYGLNDVADGPGYEYFDNTIKRPLSNGNSAEQEKAAKVSDAGYEPRPGWH